MLSASWDTSIKVVRNTDAIVTRSTYKSEHCVSMLPYVFSVGPVDQNVAKHVSRAFEIGV
jgi:hypothetical protein